MWQYYKSIEHEYDMTIMHEMTQCSFTLNCSPYTIEFTDKHNNKELNSLYKEENNYMLFSMKTTIEDDYRIKINLSHQNYQKKQEELQIEVLNSSLLYGLILLLISGLFAHYSIHPLKKALELNDEFIKDILHDFNTPISALKVNFQILQKVFGQNEAIERSQQAMNSIAELQSNLTYFLANSPLEQEQLELHSLIGERVNCCQMLFPHISFHNNVPSVKVLINKDAFIRIIDNLLSNAGKYNVTNGYVNVNYNNNILEIEDSGIGIKNPKSVFERFYKETDRGIGIGLHIVKKLCDHLNISIQVKSKLGKGSSFRLNLNEVMV